MSAMSGKEFENLVEKLCQQVEHFNEAEMTCLIREFHELLREFSDHGRDVEGLDRAKFKRILINTFRMTDDRLMDRVFRAVDKDNDGFVTLKEWIEGMALFLRGSLEEKMKYCFHVFDLNDDGYITRDEITRLLDCSLMDEDSFIGMNKLVELTVRKMDADHDDRLSYQDFEKAVKEENLLLEAFGTCLPDRMSLAMFEQRVFQEHL